MRRSSDIRPGTRNGRGRRARDRLLRDETGAPEAPAPTSEVANRVLLSGDDLREAALALSGIEAFLCAADQILEGAPAPDDIEKLLAGADIGDRLADLDAALGSLVQGLRHLRVALKSYGAAISKPATSAA
ncbi:MAG TPA: hypothetical protein VL172_14390 [Kofleriaceae bacterium]|jgi:hypothetical protein|nr:hypothetical protein [Kofleriaceae bacterium]